MARRNSFRNSEMGGSGRASWKRRPHSPPTSFGEELRMSTLIQKGSLFS